MHPGEQFTADMCKSKSKEKGVVVYMGVVDKAKLLKIPWFNF